METVFVVVYEEYSMDRFEVREVFSDEVSAHAYIGNACHEYEYPFENFRILKKMVWK